MKFIRIQTKNVGDLYSISLRQVHYARMSGPVGSRTINIHFGTDKPLPIHENTLDGAAFSLLIEGLGLKGEAEIFFISES